MAKESQMLQPARRERDRLILVGGYVLHYVIDFTVAVISRLNEVAR